jgi:exodeoxyribonuclease III
MKTGEKLPSLAKTSNVGHKLTEMKILSWNVNGIRAAREKGFLEWFSSEKADLVCVQEIKAFQDQLDEALIHPDQYHSFWHSAQKPGYSGVALFSKKEPLDVRYGIGVPEIDAEGRILVADFPDFTLLNTYFPNSQRDHARLDYKLFFCQKIFEFLESLKAQGKNIVICGDFNIAHREIDLKNPKSNEDNAGFLPQEREWMSRFLAHGYIDGFRHFEPGPGHYTWWSYRPGVRQKNIGWRIDYFVVNEEFKDALGEVRHQPDVKGSDHCPVLLQIRN